MLSTPLWQNPHHAITTPPPPVRCVRYYQCCWLVHTRPSAGDMRKCPKCTWSKMPHSPPASPHTTRESIPPMGYDHNPYQHLYIAQNPPNTSPSPQPRNCETHNFKHHRFLPYTRTRLWWCLYTHYHIDITLVHSGGWVVVVYYCWAQCAEKWFFINSPFPTLVHYNVVQHLTHSLGMWCYMHWVLRGGSGRLRVKSCCWSR